ncbi:MAG: universal stress protein [Thermodesulfovibrionales bacterium]|nr:universal stress protein [Thermodesulfovibrionales bacterium]
MFKRILYATDLSDSSLKALDAAEDIAKRNGADVIVLTVIPEEIAWEGYYVPDLTNIMKKIVSETEQRLEGFTKDRFKGLSVERIIARGRPYEEIVRIADEKDVDLIVMGSHGRTGLGRVVIGSIAMRVLRRSTKPVLIVRPK